MHKLKPKKHLGQHFLHDQEVAGRIVAALQANPDEMVVEIGPGEGVLTQRLVPRFPQLLAVEVDAEAVGYLQQHLDPKPRILHRDVLQFRPAEELDRPAHFIGNLPYNISSPFFFLLLDHVPWVETGVFMIQKEVAERICAGPGSKTYGVLSVLLGVYFEREYLFSVSPGAFRPPPKVMSGVIRLRRKPTPPEVSFSALKQVVKAAFGQRRKTLRNAIKSLSFSEPVPEAWLGQRAEQLDLSAFVYMAQQLNQGA
jgi:16S rRNA (adenine1518-N6/adenine1519-N6)-dimethyltransferase